MANEPLDLTTLVTRLRDAGLKTDVRQFLAANELLLAMAGRQPPLQDDPEGLASHLGPIFCGSPEEQQLFRQEILAWRGAPRAAPQVSAPVSRKKAGRNWLAIACVTTAVLGASGGLIAYLQTEPPVEKPFPPPPPPPPPPPQPPEILPPTSAFVVSQPVPVASADIDVIDPNVGTPPWKTILPGGLGAAVLAFLALWWRQKRRRDLVLSRMAPDPDTGCVELNPPPPTVTNIRPVALRRISAGLRRTRANEVFDLSVTATVNETARSGGFVVPVFAPRVAIPEYLVLIDRRSASDHSAQLVYGWVTQLCDQGVAADCYEFDSDPRVCREFGTQRSHRLSALLARHHRATVILCAESAVGIDPLTNRPQPWLRSFNSLPGRVFLTPAPPYRWAGNEQQLTHSGFMVAPASPTGLQIVAAMDRKSLEALGTGAKYAREFPRMLAQDTLRWLDRTPPPEATVARLLRALRDFLGPDGYAWLCACAVYPQLSWPVTLKLLDALLPAVPDIPARRAIDEQLPSIARLPWFRYGYMPDWMRKLLIAQLDPAREARVRAMLEELVCGLMGSQDGAQSAATGKDSQGLLIRTRLKALEIARSAPAGSPLQDEVFLDFLAGAAPDPLALQLSSLPHAGAQRQRSFGRRLLERWRALDVRRPWLTRAAISLLIALPVSAILWATLRETPQSEPDSDVTYRLSATMLGPAGIALQVAPNGQFMLLAAPKTGNFVEIWDLPGSAVRDRLAIKASLRNFIISPSSERVAVVDGEGEVYLWTVASDLKVERTVQFNHPGAKSSNSRNVTLAFNSDETLLLIQTELGIAVYDTESARQVSSRAGDFATITRDTDDPDWFLAFKDGSLFSLRADGKPGDLEIRKPGGQQMAFSLDARNLVRETYDPQTTAKHVEFQDTLSGRKRAEMTFPQEMTPSGWVWSGDGNLVAYEELGGVNVVYNLAADGELLRQEPRLPSATRLYTIRFSRSDQRRPNYTYYEIEERTIELVPAELPVQSPVQSPVQAPVQSPPPSRDSNAGNNTLPADDQGKVDLINKEVLASLTPRMQAMAGQLLEMARGQGITLRLVAGKRSVDPSVTHRSALRSSQSAHSEGRAFDVAYLGKDGRWHMDGETMQLVGKLGMSLGLTWAGRSGRDLQHFEMARAAAELPPATDSATANKAPPEAVANTEPAPTLDPQAQTTAAENTSTRSNTPQTFRLVKSEFEFPRDRDLEGTIKRLLDTSRNADGLFMATLVTPERVKVGQFGVRMIPSPKSPDAITEISLDARAIIDMEKPSNSNAEYLVAMNPDSIAMATNQTYGSSRSNNGERVRTGISAREFAEGKVTSARTVFVGALQFTITLEGIELRREYGEPAFDRESLRIRVSVRPREIDEVNRAQSKD